MHYLVRRLSKMCVFINSDKADFETAFCCYSFALKKQCSENKEF